MSGICMKRTILLFSWLLAFNAESMQYAHRFAEPVFIGSLSTVLAVHQLYEARFLAETAKEEEAALDQKVVVAVKKIAKKVGLPNDSFSVRSKKKDTFAATPGTLMIPRSQYKKLKCILEPFKIQDIEKDSFYLQGCCAAVIQHEANHIKNKDVEEEIMLVYPLVTAHYLGVRQATGLIAKTSYVRYLTSFRYVKYAAPVIKFLLDITIGAQMGLISSELINKYREQRADDQIVDDIDNLEGMRDYFKRADKYWRQQIYKKYPILENHSMLYRLYEELIKDREHPALS